MESSNYRKGKLMMLKDELDSLSLDELYSFLFEFIKEPMAYVMGRFSDNKGIYRCFDTADEYIKGRKSEKELLEKADSLLQFIATIEDPYDREVLYSISSALLAFIDRVHAFDAVLHDLDAIVLDQGSDEALQVIPLRIDHHSATINIVRKINSRNSYRTGSNTAYSRLIG